MLMPNAIHPTNRTLIAYLDCELPVDERHEIAGHLRECAACRAELDTIEADLDWHLVLDAALLPRYAAPSEEGLRLILQSVRQWRQEHPEAATEQHVGEALETYLGAGARNQPAPSGAMLSVFLGRNAAAALMEQIRNRERMERLAPHES